MPSLVVGTHVIAGRTAAFKNAGTNSSCAPGSRLPTSKKKRKAKHNTQQQQKKHTTTEPPNRIRNERSNDRVVFFFQKRKRPFRWNFVHFLPTGHPAMDVHKNRYLCNRIILVFLLIKQSGGGRFEMRSTSIRPRDFPRTDGRAEKAQRDWSTTRTPAANQRAPFAFPGDGDDEDDDKATRQRIRTGKK